MRPTAHLNNLTNHGFDLTWEQKGELVPHLERWNACHRCPLAGNAEHHVFFRGSIPCSVMFVGEAPGTSEDALGTPFIGRSGKLLDKIIGAALPKKRSISYLIANTVACIPLDEDGKIRPPSDEEVQECLPRLVELCDLAKPDAIVFIGKVSQKIQKKLEPKLKNRNTLFHQMYHPAYLLRKGGDSEVNVDYKRTVLELKKFLSTI